VAFGSDNCQTACFFDAFAEFDVGSATCHVGSDGDGADLAQFRKSLFPA
jgi:hypothetical protein